MKSDNPEIFGLKIRLFEVVDYFEAFDFNLFGEEI